MPRGKVSSIRALQDRALKNKRIELSSIGGDEADFQPVTLDAVTTALYELAEEFILIARNNLNKADKVSTSALMDSIVPTKVMINGDILSIDISILSYYKFVDKGVKGWQKGGGNSPFQFKKPTKGGAKGRTSKFVTSIRKWIIREGLGQRASAVGHPASKSRDSKRKQKNKFTDTSTRTAIIIAANIRRRGLEPTHFFENTEQEMVKKIKDKFALALKIDIINNLT